jgi:hypothetical protein
MFSSLHINFANWIAAHQISLFVNKILAGQKNVLLLGDELGDAGMADGDHNAGTLLKICFLYDWVRKAQKYLWITIVCLHGIMLLES